MTTSHELPPRQMNLASWYGPDMRKNPDKWVYQISGKEIIELEAALKNALNTHKDNIAAINKNSFPLPSFGRKLEEFQGQLINGLGFCLIKGLPIHRYSKLEAAALFFGIGSHLGHARSQNGQGHILGHVRDLGKSSSDPNTRIYQTHERQTFHTDSADVVGLLCLKQARNGGDSLLVSAETIYNEFQKRRPELLSCLFDPIATDRRGEIPEGMKPFFEIPVFSWTNGKLTVMYQRQYIESAQRFPDAFRLTEAHYAALDLFDELANSPDLHLSMRLDEGDMQFVYNHAMLHDRTGFEDFDEIEKRRHLYRLWLSIPGDRQLPECFTQRYGKIDIGNRGGILVPGTVLTAPIDVEP